MATHKDFRTAWVLLLLRDGASYGYELRRELGARSLQLDPAVMYRTLREMEHDDLIASRWMRSEAGPQRRVYEITQAGQGELRRVVATIRDARDAHTAFLAAFANAEASEPEAQAQ